MSGGSFDYVCFDMQDGNVDRFGSYAEDLAKHLDALATEPLDYYDTECHKRELTDEEQEAVKEAASSLRAAKKRLDEVVEEVRKLSELAHDIEWWRSCDYGAYQVLKEIMRRGR